MKAGLAVALALLLAACGSDPLPTATRELPCEGSPPNPFSLPAPEGVLAPAMVFSSQPFHVLWPDSYDGCGGYQLEYGASTGGPSGVTDWIPVQSSDPARRMSITMGSSVIAAVDHYIRVRPRWGQAGQPHVLGPSSPAVRVVVAPADECVTPGAPDPVSPQIHALPASWTWGEPLTIGWTDTDAPCGGYILELQAGRNNPWLSFPMGVGQERDITLYREMFGDPAFDGYVRFRMRAFLGRDVDDYGVAAPGPEAVVRFSG